MAEKKKDKLSPETQAHLMNAYAHIGAAIDELEAAGRISRELSIVLTKVEEAEMWSERGFVELGYDLQEIEDAEEDEEDDDAEDDGDDGDEEE